MEGTHAIHNCCPARFDPRIHPALPDAARQIHRRHPGSETGLAGVVDPGARCGICGGIWRRIHSHGRSPGYFHHVRDHAAGRNRGAGCRQPDQGRTPLADLARFDPRIAPRPVLDLFCFW